MSVPAARSRIGGHDDHRHDTDKYIIRRLSEIPTERGVCGWRKTLVTHDDTPVANVSHLTIEDSRYHYHAR